MSFAEVAKRDTFSLTPKMGKQTRADPRTPPPEPIMSRVIIPETACLAAPAAEHSKPHWRHGSQWRLGHSNSLSPQTPGTHRAPRGHRGHWLPAPRDPSGPGAPGKAPHQGPFLGWLLPDRPAGLAPRGWRACAAQLLRTQGAPEPLSCGPHHSTGSLGICPAQP